MVDSKGKYIPITNRNEGRPSKKNKQDVGRPTKKPAGFGLSATGEELTQLVAHMEELWALHPVDVDDPQAVEDRIELFFNICKKNGKRPTVSSLCLALGVTESTFKNWYNGVYRANTHQAIALKAKMTLEAMWEDWMMEGKINPVAGIFLGKNHFGYKNETDIIHSSKVAPAEKTEEDLRQKYMNSIEVDYTEVE